MIIGGLVGLLVKKGIPKRFSGSIMTGVGLCTMYIGISGALQGENVIILVASIVLGVASGTALKIDERLDSLGEKLEARFASKGNSGEKASIAQGFVTGSLLFCVGAMAIVGSINSGLTGDHTMIYAKSTLDMIAAAMLAVTLGVGVIFSAASIFVYQGALVLLARLLSPLLEDPVLIAEMNCAGSIIIIALGLNLIGVTKIKVANFLPAIIFAPVITAILTSASSG
ncbi:MAG: DUF554 domain-containing protein [Oscillospiraceae bacterium]|nr:DUF554 domain-containing protein [Oscillospiraceae bacterium]